MRNLQVSENEHSTAVSLSLGNDASWDSGTAFAKWTDIISKDQTVFPRTGLSSLFLYVCSHGVTFWWHPWFVRARSFRFSRQAAENCRTTSSCCTLHRRRPAWVAARFWKGAVDRCKSSSNVGHFWSQRLVRSFALASAEANPSFFSKYSSLFYGVFATLIDGDNRSGCSQVLPLQFKRSF